MLHASAFLEPPGERMLPTAAADDQDAHCPFTELV